MSENMKDTYPAVYVIFKKVAESDKLLPLEKERYLYALLQITRMPEEYKRKIHLSDSASVRNVCELFSFSDTAEGQYFWNYLDSKLGCPVAIVEEYVIAKRIAKRIAKEKEGIK